MKNYKKSNNLFFILICLSVLTSLALTSIFSNTVERELLNEFVGIKFVIESDTDFEASLNYTYDQKISGKYRLKNLSSSPDTLFFEFPKSKSVIKKFRLDFGNDPKINYVKIKEMLLIFNNKTIFLDQNEIFSSLYRNFSDVELDKKNKTIYFKKNAKPFDPYIIFLPLAELSLHKSIFPFALMLPFAIVLLIYFIIIKLRYSHSGLLDLLVLLFVICIPLKIAWSTFCTLLLCFYGIINAVLRQRINYKNPITYSFIALLLVLLIIGRPDDYSSVEKQLSLLFFAVISATLTLPKSKIYEYYVHLFLFFNAIMVVSGISFLISLDDFYGVGIIDYFKDIKNYSINVRKWFYYDHAAFLSLFGLIGIPFAHSLYSEKKIDIKLIYLYHILLFSFIALAGTRLCLFLYGIFLANMLFPKWNIRRRVIINLSVYALFTTLLVFNIEKIDKSRYQLWSVSWEAIKEKPLFGYGLNKSNDIINNMHYINKAGFSSTLDLNHSHNQFLTFLLEIGFIGLAAIVAILGFVTYKANLFKNRTFILFLIGLGYMFLTESVLETSKPIYVICFLLLVITTLKDQLNASCQSPNQIS